MLIAPKVAEVIKNTLVTLNPVYTKSIEDKDNHINPAKIQNVVWALEELILFIPKLI